MKKVKKPITIHSSFKDFHTLSKTAFVSKYILAHNITFEIYAYIFYLTKKYTKAILLCTFKMAHFLKIECRFFLK